MNKTKESITKEEACEFNGVNDFGTRCLGGGLNLPEDAFYEEHEYLFQTLCKKCQAKYLKFVHMPVKEQMATLYRKVLEVKSLYDRVYFADFVKDYTDVDGNLESESTWPKLLAAARRWKKTGEFKGKKTETKIAEELNKQGRNHLREFILCARKHNFELTLENQQKILQEMNKIKSE